MTFLQRIAVPALIALAVNSGLFVAIGVSNPQYLRDASLITNPDAKHYIIQGRNIFEHGTFSRCEEPPFAPDMLRTPGFPLIVGTTYQLGGVTGIFLVCAALHIFSCILITELAARLFDARIGIVAGSLLASDLMVASYNFSGMADTPFLAPLLGSLLLIVPEFFWNRDTAPRLGRVAAGSLLLGFATLMRPTALYAGILLVAYVTVAAIWRGQFTRRLSVAACISGPLLLLVGPWIARNYAVFGIAKLTTVDTNNLVYFVGGGAYQLRHDLSLQEAHDLIQREHDLPSYADAQNHWHAKHSVIEIEQTLHSAVPAVLGKYPRELAVASMLAIGKASISHSTSFVAELTGTTWTPPGTTSILRGESRAWSRLMRNNPALVAVFFWQLIHTGLTLVVGLVGTLVALSKFETRPQTLLILLVIAYLYITVSMFGLEAFYRCRIPVVPFTNLFAAVGCCWLAPRFRKLIPKYANKAA